MIGDRGVMRLHDVTELTNDSIRSRDLVQSRRSPKSNAFVQFLTTFDINFKNRLNNSIQWFHLHSFIWKIHLIGPAADEYKDIYFNFWPPSGCWIDWVQFFFRRNFWHHLNQGDDLQWNIMAEMRSQKSLNFRQEPQRTRDQIMAQSSHQDDQTFGDDQLWRNR
jgi:hypothetical protein